MKKVYVFLAEGFEEVEALTVVDLLRRANIEVCMVSVTGKTKVTGSHSITVSTDKQFRDLDVCDGDMLILPGGQPGTQNLGEHELLTELLKAWNKEGKRIAAICAAPTVLGALDILTGKQAICYPGCEEQLTGAEIVNDRVVTDGNITTGQSLGSAIPFALELIRLLRNEKTALEIKKSIVYGH